MQNALWTDPVFCSVKEFFSSPSYEKNYLTDPINQSKKPREDGE